ncbi:ATP-binding protein [Stutzerimonas stutzeri]|uniref:ATP-binding protein n=1 Tax=Stutzerimonas stutzeri TaxID=316 RepID=UPI00210AA230|nr:ATP-binding protein [Stutzerimonas stutzeri]MCQ4242491.1 ATP-binding protein [Stutzerimonas stutzeri]
MQSRKSVVNYRGSTEITGEGIKKHFRNFDPWKALFELIWNGFDARATNIRLTITRNELHGLDVVTVLDDGEGIDFANHRNNFGKFNESSKKHDQEQHGAHGRGRLSFHRLCKDATWFTKHQNNSAKITISDLDIKSFDITELVPEQQHALLSPLESGTCVELREFTKTLPTDEILAEKLGVEFGWFLALNEEKALYFNGNRVNIPSHEKRDATLTIEDEEFLVRIIRWDTRPGSEDSYNYLLDSENKIIYKQHSRFNKKPNFYPSIFINSSWAENFEPVKEDLVSVGNNQSSPVWKGLVAQIANLTQEMYDDFLRRFADQQIEKFEEQGIFPSYEEKSLDDAKWQLGQLKTVVKEIFCADPAIFNRLKLKQSKIIIRLLDRVLVSNQNDSLLDVLESVMNLDEETLRTFSSQLQRTRLDHIVSTIEALQRRETVISGLKELMEKHYSTVLETPDLQQIVECNTWLFGPAYETLGAEEESFTSTSKALRAHIKGIDNVDIGDIDEGADIEGINRQVDLFLARRRPEYDPATGRKYFRCVIIEIKRPGVALNNKHLQQLDEYASILSNCTHFGSDHTKYELVLVGRTISKQAHMIHSRIKSGLVYGEPGLVSNDGKIKMYVKNWYSIFDEFELVNDFLLDKLKTQRESLDGIAKEELVANLQQAEAAAMLSPPIETLKAEQFA